MQMSRFLYICRNWREDEARMGRMIDYLSSPAAGGAPFQLVLFPEGTNLTEKTREKSDRYAADNNLKPYRHVLHPRTTGFSFIVDRMRQGKKKPSARLFPRKSNTRSSLIIKFLVSRSLDNPR